MRNTVTVKHNCGHEYIHESHGGSDPYEKIDEELKLSRKLCPECYRKEKESYFYKL